MVSVGRVLFPLPWLTEMMGDGSLSFDSITDSNDTGSLFKEPHRIDNRPLKRSPGQKEEKGCKTRSSSFRSLLRMTISSWSRLASPSHLHNSLAVSRRCRLSTRCSYAQTCACSPSPAQLALGKRAWRSKLLG